MGTAMHHFAEVLHIEWPRKMQRPIHRTLQAQTIGIVLLRVWLGTMWLAHASIKALVFTLPVTASQFEFVGLPGYLAYPVFVAEIVGGLSLILGFMERQVSLLLVPLLLTATWVYLPNSWLHTRLGGGWEYPLLLSALSVALWLRILQQYLPAVEIDP
jgi:putative oxidoreductase